jgi:hypothetical protein
MQVLNRVIRQTDQRASCSGQLLPLVLGSLLPALWLLATGLSCWDATMDCAGERCAPFGRASQGKRLPVQSSCTFEHSVRSNCRAWANAGPDGFLPILTASESVLPKLLQSDGSPTLDADAVGLAKSWQFYWRTALAPRAPFVLF